MPKFIYTAILFTALLWWLFIHQLLTTPPESFDTILVVLIILFFALGLTLSFPFYYLLYRKVPTFTKLRLIYRRALKWSFFISFGLTFIFGMRAFGVYTLINLLLFTVLYYAIYLQIRVKR